MHLKAPHLFHRPVGLVLICFYELITGLFQIFVGLNALILNRFTDEGLKRDADIFLIHWFLDISSISLDSIQRISYTFLFFGIVKLLIGYGIWLRSWMLRRAMIFFFLITTSVIAIDIIIAFSFLKLLTFGIDLIFLFYLWKVLPKHLHHPDALGIGEDEEIQDGEK